MTFCNETIENEFRIFLWLHMKIKLQLRGRQKNETVFLTLVWRINTKFYHFCYLFFSLIGFRGFDLEISINYFLAFTLQFKQKVYYLYADSNKDQNYDEILHDVLSNRSFRYITTCHLIQRCFIHFTSGNRPYKMLLQTITLKEHTTQNTKHFL